MTNKDIKNKMYELYQALQERNDESYYEFYNALHTLYALYMIPDKQWEMIKKFDKELAETF